MNRTVATILVVIGAVLLIKLMASTATLFLVAALVLALLAGIGAIDRRWGYGIAIALAVFALPGLVISGIFRGLALLGYLFKLFPLLLLLIGGYMLLRPRR